MEAISVIKPGTQAVRNDLFCFGVVGTRIVALRFAGPGWVEEDRLPTDADIVKMKTTTVQLSDNTYAIAVGWIEINNRGREWKLALFDGKTFRRINAVAGAQPLFGVTDIYLAHGSVQRGTTEKNVLQIFLESGGTDKSMPQITLLRAEYELLGNDGNEGSMMTVGKGKWGPEYPFRPLYPNEGGGNDKLCTQRLELPNDDAQPGLLKIFTSVTNVTWKENGPLPGISTVRIRATGGARARTLRSSATWCRTAAMAGPGRPRGYLTRIGLLGATPGEAAIACSCSSAAPIPFISSLSPPPPANGFSGRRSLNSSKEASLALRAQADRSLNSRRWRGPDRSRFGNVPEY